MVGSELRAQHRFELLSTHISVAHANDAIARRLQEPSSRMIVVSLRLRVVHISLELDHDPLTGAIEIHDEAVQYMLSPKLQIQNAAIAQQRPCMTFGRSGMQPQLAGARVSLGRSEAT